MESAAYNNRGFDDTGTALGLLLSNAEVDTHNACCLHQLGKPILLKSERSRLVEKEGRRDELQAKILKNRLDPSIGHQ
jgi:hypothetical protein